MAKADLHEDVVAQMHDTLCAGYFGQEIPWT